MQLPLQLTSRNRQTFDTFVAGENQEAVGALRALLVAEDATSAFVSGPECSGKTHLLIAACREVGDGAQYLPLKALGADVERALIHTPRAALTVIDDVQELAGQREAEIALFDLFNRGRETGMRFVFSARAAPAHIPLTLPDLVSRLQSCVRFQLKPLQESQRRQVLQERAVAKGFELDDAVLDFLFRRHARDLGALLDMVDRLDRESLVAQKKVTVHFLRQMMSMPGPRAE